MADTAIRATGGADAPLSYLVPGSAVIRIKQMHVKYVDNTAGGNWLPAVRIVDDAGHTMGTAADQNVSVNAGDDADVSFFPGVKHGGSATPALKQPVFSWEQDVGAGDFPVGTYQPNIIAVTGNADGASSFVVSPVDPSQLLVALAGVYNIAVLFSSGDGTLTAGSSVGIGATVGAFGGGTNGVAVGGPSAGTVGFYFLAGVIGPFALAVNDQIGINFTVGQHFHFVNKFGGTIFRLGGPKTF